MVEFELAPGLVIAIDPERFTEDVVLRLSALPSNDCQLSLDLTITDVISKSEQKVQGIVKLRTK